MKIGEELGQVVGQSEMEKAEESVVEEVGGLLKNEIEGLRLVEEVEAEGD